MEINLNFNLVGIFGIKIWRKVIYLIIVALLLWMCFCKFLPKIDRDCTPTQFKCATGGKCIEGIYRCDGHSDCPDRSDEDCPSVTANETITHSNSPKSTPFVFNCFFPVKEALTNLRQCWLFFETKFCSKVSHSISSLKE